MRFILFNVAFFWNLLFWYFEIVVFGFGDDDGGNRCFLLLHASDEEIIIHVFWIEIIHWWR